MSSQIPNINPTGYLGSRAVNPPNIWQRNRAPLTTDYDNYVVGDFWIWETNEQTWQLVNKLAQVATWSPTAGVPGNIDGLTPDIGGTVFPTANIVNVKGNPLAGVQTQHTGANNLTVSVADATTVGFKGVSTYNPVDFTVVGGLVSLAAVTNFTWNAVVTANRTLVPNNGYYNLFAGLCTYTLPLVCAVGTIIQIAGVNFNGWILNQNAGQVINLYGNFTTIGAGGSIASVNSSDCISLLCIGANLAWTSYTGGVGSPLVT